MTIRSDLVAGAAFILLAVLVFVLGADLPFGTLASPGAGMMPKLVALLMIVFAVSVMTADRTGVTIGDIDWSDWWHALQLVAITSVAIVLYRTLGFLVTMSLLVFALLVVVERRGVVPAAAYAVGLTLFAYWLFAKALMAPIERGILWF